MINFSKLRITIIFGILHLFPICIDLISLLIGSYDGSISNYLSLTPFEYITYLAYSATYCVIFMVVFFGLSPKSFRFNTISFDKKSVKTLKIAKIIFIIFVILIFIKIYNIFKQDFLLFFIGARSGQIPIGFSIYSVLIFFPIIVGILLHEKKFYWWILFGLVILTFLNLVTGFRILLFWGLTFILMLHLKFIFKIKISFLIAFLLIFLSIMFFYQEYREIIQGSTGGSGRGIIDSLNRSIPIYTLKLIFDNSVYVDINDIIKLLISPFAIIVNSILGVRYLEVFDQIKLSENLYYNYLFWRDGYYSNAGGFSINIVSFSMFFYGGVGLFLFATFSAASCVIGMYLLKSNNILRRAAGALITNFTFFSAVESFIEAWKLLIYSMIFLLFFLILVKILNFLTINIKGNPSD
jgi:hypothetical protein